MLSAGVENARLALAGFPPALEVRISPLQILRVECYSP